MPVNPLQPTTVQVVKTSPEYYGRRGMTRMSGGGAFMRSLAADRENKICPICGRYKCTRHIEIRMKGI